MSRTFWLHTLGCPKNEVDSAKLAGKLVFDGLSEADDPGDADLIVVNTCAFIEDARVESVDAILELAGARRPGAEVVVTGCMAERYGSELADAIPEVAQVAGFGTPVTLGATRNSQALPAFDLLNLPRPASAVPWAYVKIAEGCDRKCGFCAIPSFRGPQRSRTIDSIVEEIRALRVREVVLVAQDLASFGRDQGVGERRLADLVSLAAAEVDWVRMLYLYPSDLDDRLIDSICATGVPYFDLSLQHVSRPLLRKMRRWGDGARFIDRIDAIRRREPGAAFRSNFIVGYPGETESDHDELIRFVESTRLDWCGFFAYSPEDGTYAVGLPDRPPAGIVAERLAELGELQDRITAERQDGRVGQVELVLVERPGRARSAREAPEIDGTIEVPTSLEVGEFHKVRIESSTGLDLVAEPV